MILEEERKITQRPLLSEKKLGCALLPSVFTVIEERLTYVRTGEDIASWQGGTEVDAMHHKSHCICIQEAERGVCWCSAHFLPFRPPAKSVNTI